jgi:hypothetical protein
MIDNKTQPAARGVYALVEALRARFIKVEIDEPEKTIKR